jgi:hypothetical protein
VDVDPDLARTRIAKRHINAKIETNLEGAYRRVEGNDMLNGAETRKKLVPPDILVQSVEESL